MFRKTKKNKDGIKKANTIASNARGSEGKVSKETKKTSKEEESKSATSTTSSTSRDTYQPLHTQRSVSEEERSNEEKRMRDVRP